MNKSHITLTCSEEKLVAQKNLVFVSDFFFLATFSENRSNFSRNQLVFQFCFLKKCSYFVQSF